LVKKPVILYLAGMIKDKKTPKQTANLFDAMTTAMVSGNSKPKVKKKTKK
jgi:hypothetical protein